MSTEFNYILQEREHINIQKPIYKIGRTKQEGLRRFKQYPKESKLIIQESVSDCCAVEKEIIKLFDKKFTNRREIGREYYEGDIVEIKKYFRNITDKYTINNDEKQTVINNHTITKKYKDYPNIINDSIILFTPYVFAYELEKVINDIINVYNKENKKSIKIDHYCDDNLDKICEIINELSENKKIDRELKKIYEINCKISEIICKINSDLDTLFALLVIFLKYFRDFIVGNFFEGYEDKLEDEIINFFDKNQKNSWVFLKNEKVCEGFINYFCKKGILFECIFDKNLIHVLEMYWHGIKRSGVNGYYQKQNEELLDKLLSSNEQDKELFDKWFFSNKRFFSNKQVDDEIPLTTITELFASIVYISETNSIFSFLTKEIFDKYVNMIRKKVNFEIIKEQSGYSGFVYCSDNSARFITDKINDDLFKENLEGWVTNNVDLESDKFINFFLVKNLRILCIYNKFNDDFLRKCSFDSDICDSSRGPICYNKLQDGEYVRMWSECRFDSDEYLPWFTNMFENKLKEKMEFFLTNSFNEKLTKIVKTKNACVTEFIDNNNKNIIKQVKILEYCEHPIYVSSEINSSGLVELKIINMNDKIFVDNCYYHSTKSNGIGIQKEIDNSLNYEKIVRLSFGQTYLNYVNLLNSILIEQKNLFCCVVHKDETFLGCLTYLVNFLDYDCYNIDLNEYNILEHNVTKNEIDEIITRIKKNKDKKLIIIYKHFFSTLTSSQIKMINMIIDNRKKYNANIIIQSEKYISGKFKCDPEYIEYDSAKIINEIKNLNKGKENGDKYTYPCLLFEKCRPEFFNWFLKTKIFQ